MTPKLSRAHPLFGPEFLMFFCHPLAHFWCPFGTLSVPIDYLLHDVQCFFAARFCQQGLPHKCTTLVTLEMYHVDCLKNVPLGLPQKCTTWVASEMYHLGRLRNVPLGSPQKCTTWIASKMYNLGCLKMYYLDYLRNVPLGLP